MEEDVGVGAVEGVGGAVGIEPSQWVALEQRSSPACLDRSSQCRKQAGSRVVD